MKFQEMQIYHNYQQLQSLNLTLLITLLLCKRESINSFLYICFRYKKVIAWIHNHTHNLEIVLLWIIHFGLESNLNIKSPSLHLITEKALHFLIYYVLSFTFLTLFLYTISSFFHVKKMFYFTAHKYELT